MAATFRRRAGKLVVVLLSALLGTGCGALEPAPQRDARAELALRSPVEEMVRRYDYMLERVRARLDAELGPFVWSEGMGRLEHACDQEELAALGARIIRTPMWTFEGSISGDGWPLAQRIVADLAREFDFAAPVTMEVDSPGVPSERTSRGVNPDLGAFYDFETHNAYTSIRITSGCHLPARLHGEL